MQKYFVLLFFILYGTNASAASLFGAEFTFTNSVLGRSSERTGGRIVDLKEVREAQELLLMEFTKKCLANNTCTIEPVPNSYNGLGYKVIFKDQNNFWIQISTDPAVVEIQTKPSTVEEYKGAKKILDHLFTSAAKTGITPHIGGRGGGHIHMDFATTFGNDAKLFRNFVVDFMNHPELGGDGVLGGSKSNSPPLARLSLEQKNEFRAVIAEFDAGKIKTARDLSKAINNRVYTSSTTNTTPPSKYQALNLVRMSEVDGVATVELRAISPQRNIEDFYLETELFEARVEFLRKQSGSIKILDLEELSEKGAVSAFRSYVEESGLKWDEYKGLVRKGNQYVKASTPAMSRVSFHDPEDILRDSQKPGLCSKLFGSLK